MPLTCWVQESTRTRHLSPPAAVLYPMRHGESDGQGTPSGHPDSRHRDGTELGGQEGAGYFRRAEEEAGAGLPPTQQREHRAGPSGVSDPAVMGLLLGELRPLPSPQGWASRSPYELEIP